MEEFQEWRKKNKIENDATKKEWHRDQSWGWKASLINRKKVGNVMHENNYLHSICMQEFYA